MLHLTCQYAGSLGDAADSLVLLQRLLKPSGGKKVDVAQEELCSPRRIDMVHASVAKWYNSTGKGAALRTRFGPFPATPEALNKWYARNKVMTAFLDDQGVPPEF